MCIVFLLASPFDELSNYAHYWFTYNSYMVNFGSLMGGLPGVVQPHRAGANEAWPIFLIPAAYIVIFVGLASLGSKLMGGAKRRWPSLGPVRLILLCYVAIMLVYLVIDGVICMPLGFWAFQGGHWPINGTSYFKYPINEMIFAGAVFTFPACVRYFVNDRGDTIAERGIERVHTTPGRKAVLRGLALVGVLHLGLLFTYHLPQGILATSATHWPKDIQNRSYLTDGVCGHGTDRACPS
jgi:hypothetical protein